MLYVENSLVGTESSVFLNFKGKRAAGRRQRAADMRRRFNIINIDCSLMLSSLLVICNMRLFADEKRFGLLI